MTVQPRIIWLDLARTAALVCMIIFHFCYDLAMFGLIPAEAVVQGPMRIFAICIAGSFLALAGISQQVVHGAGIRWPGFRRRFVMLATAACVISVLTYIWVPDSFIFFGILHAIALASLLGLAFLRLPAVATAATAIAVLVLPQVWGHAAFDALWLQWTGLGLTMPVTLDYEPIFPWFAAFLGGMVLAKMMAGTRLLARHTASPMVRKLSWPGQYSLWIYLAHQPVLIALLWSGLWLLRP